MIEAEVAKVNLGKIEIDGLRWFDDKKKQQYGSGFPQIATLFDIPQKNASRDFKALLGEDLTILKVKIKNTRVILQVLLLDQLEKLFRKLDRKGNVIAQNLVDDLMGLSLTVRFNDAFGVENTPESNTVELAVRDLKREMGKVDRKNWVKTIRNWCKKHKMDHPMFFRAFEIEASDELNVLLTGHVASYWREKLEITDNDYLLRDDWSFKQLDRIAKVETLATQMVIQQDMPPTVAIRKAVNLLGYIVWTEEQLIDKKETI
jgi:hypothetical protein